MVNIGYCFEDSSILICQNLDFQVQAQKMTSTYQTFQGFLDPR